MSQPEEWRSVVGHEGVYEVSSFGRVRSLTRSVMIAGYPCLRRGKILRANVGSAGYPQVCLWPARITRYVHQLVAGAFIGPVPSGQECRHKDGNRLNPAASNLEYGTHAENIADAVRHGTWHLSHPGNPNLSKWWKGRKRHGQRGKAVR